MSIIVSTEQMVRKVFADTLDQSFKDKPNATPIVERVIKTPEYTEYVNATAKALYQYRANGMSPRFISLFAKNAIIIFMTEYLKALEATIEESEKQ